MPGAIWGQVHLGKQQIEKARIPYMEQSMREYRIDKVEHIEESYIYFSCAHQYVVQGAEKEKLPFLDEKNQIFFTADCILDNRKELVEALPEADGELPDGALAYHAYLHWGEEFVKHLVGIFSFAFYKANENQVLLYTDHTGSRCINYCKRGKVFVFSTTYGPVLQAFGEENMKFCEKWLVGCESFRAPDMILFPGLTPFEGVYQLEAGHYLKVTANKIEKICYWNPAKNVKKLRLSGDEEYKKLFLKTFQICVTEMLRSSEKTAITLSSGLDSSAVACMAAPVLEERGETLYAYTSVPLKDFDCVEGFDLMEESAGPRRIASRYHNLCPNFVSCEGKSVFSELERFVRYTEVPGKSNANLVWLDEIYQKARRQGCRIVLKGQYGNSTISYGAILSLAYQRLLKLRVSSAKNAVRAFRKRRRVSRQRVIRVAESEWRSKWNPDLSMVEESYVQKRLKEKYRVRGTIRKMLRFGGGSAMDSEREHKNFMSDLRIFQHLGLYDTRFGLTHGIVVRDPTKDKRIIELCMAFPMECFAGQGIERRMVREYMKEIIPAEICNDVNHRGMQSADFVYRLNKHWDAFKKEIFALLKEERLYQFLEQEKLEAFVREAETWKAIPNQTIAQDITVLQAFSLFLKQYERVKL